MNGYPAILDELWLQSLVVLLTVLTVLFITHRIIKDIKAYKLWVNKFEKKQEYYIYFITSA